MTLNLYEAETMGDLSRQCDARTIAHLARLMLRTFATLGATAEWGDLPDLAESLALSASRVGLAVDQQDQDSLDRWQAISETSWDPLPVLPAQDTFAVTVAALGVADVFRDGTLGHDIGPRLNCDESDALVALLDATGAHDAAQHLRRGHAESDEEGDAHYMPTA